MKSILFYLSIICVIFAVGCDRKRHISIGTAPARRKSDTFFKLVNDSASANRRSRQRRQRPLLEDHFSLTVQQSLKIVRWHNKHPPAR